MELGFGVLLVVGGIWCLLTNCEYKEDRIIMAIVVMLGAALLLK